MNSSAPATYLPKFGSDALPSLDSAAPVSLPANLLRLLERTVRTGFKLAVIETSTPGARSQLLDQIRRFLDPLVVTVRGVDISKLQGFNFWHEVSSIVLGDQGSLKDTVLAIWGFEGLKEGGMEKIFRQLNVQRDLFVRDMPCPWLLFIHPAMRHAILNSAPDFSDFAALWLEAEPAQAGHPVLTAAPEHAFPTAPPVSNAAHWPELLRKASDALDRWEPALARDLLGQFDLTSTAPQKDALQRNIVEARLKEMEGDPAGAREILATASAALSLEGLEESQGMDLVAAWFVLAQLDARLGYPETAERRLRRCLGAYEKKNLKRGRASALGEIARILVFKGQVADALKLHQEELEVYEELGDKRSRAVTLGDMARILVFKGQVEEALKLDQDRLAVFEELGDKRSRAVTLGDIARILVSKGQVEAALKLHQEELKVYEELGDKRSRAVTLGDIADILVAKGQVDVAIKLHQERLAVFDELGDIAEKAHTLWSVARIDVQRASFQSAYERLAESYAILEKLGRLDGICFVGMDLGKLLCGGGHREDGLRILARSRDGFTKLGQTAMAEQVARLIDQINKQS